MILRNEDLINKLGQREVVNEAKLLHKIDGRKFYVYVDNKPFKGFDSLSVWNGCLHFNRTDSIKYGLLDGFIKTETSIVVPFENCLNMSLVIGDETINISDYKRTEDLVEIRKDVLSIGDYIRIHYYGTNNHGDYSCTGTVVDITQQTIMLYIPSGDSGIRHINIHARELLHNKVIVGIEILHKVEKPSFLNEPSSPDDDDDDDDDSPKYDVITESE